MSQGVLLQSSTPSSLTVAPSGSELIRTLTMAGAIGRGGSGVATEAAAMPAPEAAGGGGGGRGLADQPGDGECAQARNHEDAPRAALRRGHRHERRNLREIARHRRR